MDDLLTVMSAKSEEKQLTLAYILEVVLKLAALPESELEQRMAALQTTVIANYDQGKDGQGC